MDIFPALLRTISSDILKYVIDPKGKKILKNLAVVSWGLLNLFQGLKASYGGIGVSAKDALVGSKSAMKDLSKHLNKSVFTDINEIDKSIYYEAWQLLKRLPLEVKLFGRPISILIFIDDLDRCLPNIAFNLLEKLKIWLEIDNYTSILALNQHEIRMAVHNHLQKESSTANNDCNKEELSKISEDYLAKILPLSLYVKEYPIKNFLNYGSGSVTKHDFSSVKVGINVFFDNLIKKNIIDKKGKIIGDIDSLDGRFMTLGKKINLVKSIFKRFYYVNLETKATPKERLEKIENNESPHRRLRIFANESYLEECVLNEIKKITKKEV